MSYHLTLDQLRFLISKIVSSPQRRTRFHKLCREEYTDERRWHLMVIRDVRTRWNWTYCMIKRAFQLKEGVDAWTLQIDKGAFSELKIKKSEWEELDRLRQLLEVNTLSVVFVLCVHSSRSRSIATQRFYLRRRRQHSPCPFPTTRRWRTISVMSQLTCTTLPLYGMRRVMDSRSYSSMRTLRVRRSIISLQPVCTTSSSHRHQANCPPSATPQISVDILSQKR